MRLTECSSASRGSIVSAERACRRRSDATVCRLFLTRWWISCASTPRITARPCSSATAACVAIDASSSRSASVNGVARSATSSPICAAAPAQRLPDRVRVGDALGPRDVAVVEHERRAGRVQRVHRRLDDRLERLLEVERLGDRLGDARERLELVHAPLRLGVELRVLDRLRDLRRDREQQLDLVLGERARLAGAHVERALERAVARQDRHGEDRLVLVLGQVREVLEARVEVRLRREHHRRARRRRRAGDSLARPHPRAARHLVDRACRASRAARARPPARRRGRRSTRPPRARRRPSSRRATAPPAGRASS